MVFECPQQLRALLAPLVAGIEVVPLTGFMATPRAIMSMDLVVSVDTAVAHLAGALGKPVWMLLSRDGEWRWLLARDDSPWYPRMRIFRRQRRGRWGPVIGHVCAALPGA